MAKTLKIGTFAGAELKVAQTEDIVDITSMSSIDSYPQYIIQSLTVSDLRKIGRKLLVIADKLEE